MGLSMGEFWVIVELLAESSEPNNGRTIGKTCCFPQIQRYSNHSIRLDSPTLSSNVPLLRLEPILRKLAEDRNPGRVLFSHAVTDFEDDGHKVVVTVQQPNGNTLEYHAQYVVCADGGKLSTPKLGIKMEGPTGLVDFVSTHFKADLSEYWDGKLEPSLLISKPNN
jgi:2,4-dichlorophenol 6-monooxygenase